jgi:hypothetical protein
MLYALISFLFIFWLVGIVAHIGDGFIHTLLAVALGLLLFNMIKGRRVGGA